MAQAYTDGKLYGMPRTPTKVTVSDADLLAANRAGMTQRQLASEHDVALGTIAKRVQRAKKVEAAKRAAAKKAKAERRRRLAAAHRSELGIQTTVPMDSVEEQRRLAAAYHLSDGLPVETAPGEDDARSGRAIATHDVNGYVFVARNFPDRGRWALCLDRVAMTEICRHDDALTTWFVHELVRENWMVAGEADPRERYGYRPDRLVRCPDGGRRRMFCVRGHEELLQLRRTLRGLRYDARLEGWQGFAVPIGSLSTARFVLC